ncbi:TrkA domain protein [Syntrophotalea carbinolica DSM 2380]|uniref:TrkA domain protein n=1 Tax=Syntrophotalea carbinolica (strain DSM 2380 / NBRC 103641 / GraBd1) TaxID=338963 RepID=Q39ZU5_SYNC1|nr:potassium channel protein [Syntrophotalea carbinolica]ABA90362.1 TrkA domain protein [Syntrophotalea carbinolica DSM 2380]
MNPVRHLRFSLLILVLAIGLGTAGYILIEGWDFLDSLYMTVITLATVGYKEVHDLSTEGKIFTISLIVFGVATIAYAAGSLLQLMVEGQILHMLGRRKLEKRINQMEGHYIICGYGRIGTLISQEFISRPVPFVIVERDQAICDSLAKEGILFVQGDATDDDTLIQAGILRAKGLITAVTSESANVYITLTARGLNPDLFILARSVEEGSEIKLKRAGATKVISPYRIGANRMAWAVLRPSVVDFIDIAVGSESLELQLEEIRVAPTSTLVDKSLVSSDIRRAWGIMIIAIKKSSGAMLFNPESNTTIDAEDILITLGEPPAIRKLEQVACGGTVNA